MFIHVQNKVIEQFKKILSCGKLFAVEVDKDEIWEIYFNSFSEDKRQENNCRCCQNFLRQYAGIVGIDKNGNRLTLWDFEIEDEEYKNPIKELRRYIAERPITGIFLNPFAKCGTQKNADTVRNVVWNHFYIELPREYVMKDSGPVEGVARANKQVLKRGLEEITDDAIDTTLELIGQNSLYRGKEFEPIVKKLQTIKKKYKSLKPHQKENFCWAESSKPENQAVSRINNSAIGTLLNDLSEGKELDKAVSAFERVVAPANYKRPTALVTPRMIDDAKKRLEELGLIGALKRRQLSRHDLNINNALFVHRDTPAEDDIFSQAKKKTSVNSKGLSKTEEISIKEFVNKVLPTAKSIKLFVENKHLNNFVSLVGPQDTETGTLFKWGNSYSWSYTNGTADAIKERVKAAGGKVDGVLRVSLSWSNYDDLDLAVVEPGRHKIWYGDKGPSPSGGRLDVDENAGMGKTRTPVENIYWKTLPKIEGRYQVLVNQFSKRENVDSGFEVEIEFDSQIYNFSCQANGQSGHTHKVIEFDYSKQNGIEFIGQVKTQLLSKEKWGISTGQFHNVKALTYSPNFWVENGMGNRHYMFFLENCKSDESSRAYYNEFLAENLSKDRKAFEILANHIKVESCEDELSGLGFSDTLKSSVIVQVQGAFQRTLKINF